MDGMNKDAKLNRDMSLDAVKGFAILLVMLGHCIVLNGLADAYFYDAIAAVQMPLFMAVSGYLAGLKVFDSAQKPDLKDRAMRFGKRSIAYLVPFFSWMVFVSFPHCLTELKTELFHLDYGLWFLATLWIITLVTMIAAYLADLAACRVYHKYTEILNMELPESAVKKFENKSVKESSEVYKRVACIRFLLYCLVVFVCYFGFFVQGRCGNTFLSPNLTVRYMPFYVAAYLVSYYVVPYVRNAGRIWTVLCVVSMIVFVILVVLYDMIVAPELKIFLIQMTASFLGTFAVFYAVAHIPKGKIQSFLAFIGQYTLEIYVLHFRFARLLKLADRNLVPFQWNTVLWLFAAFVVMSVLTAVSVFVLKYFRITDFLCFGKIRPRKRK